MNSSCRSIRNSTVPAGKGLVIDKEIMFNSDSIITPIADRRPIDQTFLTFPEWYLVFSPEEQANYFKNHTATNFPYLKHISQFWKSYAIMKEQIKGNYPRNTGYHFMIKVIGLSATFEYGFKSIYENSIGRLTDLGNKGYLTEEDVFYANYTTDYVNFIRVNPWYEFNFISRLPTLWKVPYFKRHPIRKIERKLFLTTELLFKSIYGGLIKIGTKTAYDIALPNTVVLLNKTPDTLSLNLPFLKIIKTYPDSSALVSMPRYDAFKDYARVLASRDIQFKEIAGNNSVILLTLVVPSNYETTFENTYLVFTQSITSDVSKKRIAVATSVKNLSSLLKKLEKENILLEHVFDY
jgi:hypothetical protein